MEKKRPPHGGSGGGRTVKKSRGGNKNGILRRRHFGALCARVADGPPLGGRYNLTDKLQATDLDSSPTDGRDLSDGPEQRKHSCFFFTLFLDLVLHRALGDPKSVAGVCGRTIVIMCVALGTLRTSLRNSLH